MSIQQNNLTGIANAIRTKKGTTDLIVANDFAEEILSIPTSGSGTGEWVRPNDRPEVPVLNNNEIYMLFKVNPFGINDIYFTLSSSPSSNTKSVNWGDGTTSQGVVIPEHIYNFDTLDKPINPDGSKWVWIYIRGAGLTAYGINVRPTGRPTASSTSIYVPNIYEMYINASTLNAIVFVSGTYTRYSLCDILDIKSSAINSWVNFCSNWTSLKKLNINSTESSTTTMQSFLSSCPSLNDDELIIPSTTNTSMNAFMLGCINQENVDTNIGNIASNITAIFNESTPRRLKNLRLRNMNSSQTTINLGSCLMNRNAIVILTGDLYDRTGLTAGTFIISNTPAASQMNSTDIVRITQKNWTVSGFAGY